MNHKHFTAWLSTDPGCLDQDNADLTVLQDEWTGVEWLSIGNPVFYQVTTHRVDEDDNGDLLRDTEALLNRGGWTLTGSWTGVSSGYVVSVTRKN